MADRTVTTNLVLRVRDYVTPARAAKAETKGVTESVVAASRASDKLGAAAGRAGKAADGLGDELSATGRAARKLDGDIEDLEREILKLKVAMAGVDGDAFKQMDRQLRGLEGSLRRRLNVRKAFSDAGDDGAEALSLSFVQRIGPLLARAPLSPHLALAAAGAAPALSAAVGGAISAGAAVGAVAIGAKLAASTTEGEAAVESFTASVSRTMQAAAQPMVEPFIDALDDVQDEITELGPSFRRIFSDAAEYTPIFTRAVNESAASAVDDFEAIVDNAEPVVEVLGEHIPKAVDAMSSALRTASEDSENTAAALDSLFTVLESVVQMSGLALKGLNMSLPVTSWPVLLIGELGELDDASDDAAGSADELASSWGDATKQARAFVGETRTLIEILDDYAQINATAFDAQTAFGAALDDLTVKQAHRNAGIDEGTSKGRENRDMLSDLADATRSAARNMEEAGATQAEVNGTMNTGFNRFMKLADAMGLDADKARELARRLGLIPADTKPKVKTEGVPAAISDAARVERKLEDLERTYRATIRVSYSGLLPSFAEDYRSAQRVYRWGGIEEHARTGLLRDAAIYSPMSRARYAFAEPATGGEAFVPKHGNYERSMQILNRAAGWYGASVRPGGGGGQVATLRLIQETPDGRVIREQLIDFAGRINVPPVQLWPAA